MGARGLVQRTVCVVLVAAALSTIGRAEAPVAAVEGRKYQPGEKLSYKTSVEPEVWKEATFLGTTADGAQPIIRETPNELFKDGFERAAQWSEIRPAGEKSAAARPAAVNNGPLMTQEQILAFLAKEMGDEPFKNPRREAIKKELTAMIKHRGLDFHYEALSDFGKKSSKYGIGTEVTFPLRSNFGPPTARKWLLGAWRLDKIGAAVDFTKNGDRFRQTETAVKDVGVLTLSGDNTYEWKVSGVAAPMRGNWRDATTDEMKDQGGEGIVLLKAKGTWDWIVTQNRSTQLKGEWIKIDEITSRQIRESGRRQGEVR